MDYFGDPTKGKPVPNGDIYIGEPGFDPGILGNRKNVVLQQENGTEVTILPAGQPLNTGAGGYILYNGSPVTVLTSGSYSIKVNDKLGAQKFYSDNVSGSPGTGDTIAAVDTIAEMLADPFMELGDYYSCGDYADGNGAGELKFKAVPAGTGTADGASYFDHDTLPLQLERIFDSIVTAKDFGAVDGGDITDIITTFMASDIDEIHLGPHSFTGNENWPYQPTDGKKIKGVRNRTTLTYVGAAGTLGNEVEFIKLRTAARGAVSGGGFEDIKVDLGSIAYVRGISLVYFTNQSAVGGIEVANVGVGSEAIVCDKLWYTNWGPIALINNPVAKTGSGLVIRPTTDSNDSVNSHNLTQIRVQGFEHNILLDSTIAGINTIKLRGSSEAGTNGVTHLGVYGVSEADIDLHMESNITNVRWQGSSISGAGVIKWRGRWNDAAGGDVKFGHSYHYISAKIVGTVDLYKWGTAKTKLEGAYFADQGGTAGTEDVGAVTYTYSEDTSAIPGWKEAQQAYVNVNSGDWIKGASQTSFATTTGYVEYDFSGTVSPASGYSIVKIMVAYLRPDGSRKAYEAIALKRSADTTNYLLTQTGGDALDANFDVILTAAGLLRIKSAISESILYAGRVDPF